MYKSRISLWQIILSSVLFFWGIIAIANFFGIIYLSNFNSNFITPAILLGTSLLLLTPNIKRIGIKINFEGEYLIIEQFQRQKKIMLSSIVNVDYKNDYNDLLLSTTNTKTKVSLQLKNSSVFLAELYERLRKQNVTLDKNEDLYALMRNTVRDHQSERLRSYLWIPVVVTFLTFYSAVLLTDSLTALNIFRIIILIVLPITTFLLPEVSFANYIEKQYRFENRNEVKRDINHERHIYKKYFLISSIICLLLFISFMF